MASALERLAYGAAQSLRISWYWGQKLAAASRSEHEKLPEEVARRMPTRGRLLRDLRLLLVRDWQNIAAGRYELPPDLIPNPLPRLARSRRFFADLPQVEARRRAEANSEVMQQAPRGRFPRYYLQNFHYQSDGYLSRESAALYDHQVEVLFGGGADAMRRQALVPLGEELRRIGTRRARLIDIACGTGRFLREVKHNYPRLAVTALDLSPYYLDAARDALAPWSDCVFVEAAAEDTALPAGTFDVATAIYLFHELPQKQRRLVAGEIARLLKPGGMFILLDSLQFGDEPDYDVLIEHFPRRFHEPYYTGYARQDLAALFGEAGLACELTERVYFSKLMVFRKAAAAAV